MQELRIEADLRLGRHQALTSELRELTVRHPLHEGFHAKLMVALHRSGRSNESLEVYQRLRSDLDDQLGIGPSPLLQRVHVGVLQNDDVLDVGKLKQRESVYRAAPAASEPLPAQLPPDTADFSGRRAELAALRAVLVEQSAAPDAPSDPVPGSMPGTATRMVLMTGMPGIGKTTIALRAAHLSRSDFPDGQFYARLSDAGGAPVEPTTVLSGFLRAAGFGPERVPSTVEEQSALLRSWNAERRMLMVLDDARSAAQVMPLLPGGSQCAVLLTSRSALPSLAGTRSMRIGPLSEDEAIAMFAAVVGDSRVDDEPESTLDVVRMLGGLPLAIRAAGTSLRDAEHRPVGSLLADLSLGRHPFDELVPGELDVWRCLGESYDALDTVEQGLLRRICRFKTRPFTASDVAGVAGEGTADQVELLLAGLSRKALLLTDSSATQGKPCYVLPELLWTFARERLFAVEPEARWSTADGVA